MKDKPYNSADEKQVADAKRKEHNDSQSEINDLRAIMNTAHGRRTVWRLLCRCGIYRTSFDKDPIAMAFNEGGRNIGLQYISELTEQCLENYLLMVEEQTKLKQK